MDENGSGGAESAHFGSGEYSEWEHIAGEPFNDVAGPFHHRRDRDESLVFAFTPAARTINNMGIVHGGCILTFADYCLFVTAREKSGPLEVVTVSMASEFVGMAFPNTKIECRTEIVKAGRSLIFVRGIVSGPSGAILSFSGVAKTVADRKWTPPAE